MGEQIAKINRKPTVTPPPEFPIFSTISDI